MSTTSTASVTVDQVPLVEPGRTRSAGFIEVTQAWAKIPTWISAERIVRVNSMAFSSGSDVSQHHSSLTIDGLEENVDVLESPATVLRLISAARGSRW